MAKLKVGTLLGDQLHQVPSNQEPPARSAVVPDSGSAAVPDSGTAALPESGTTHESKRLRAVAEAPPDSGVAALPKYLQLERKDTRLRADQLDALSRLARRLQRTGGRTERITENTLIRVAVDMLLAAGDTLAGRDEEELRATAVGRQAWPQLPHSEL